MPNEYRLQRALERDGRVVRGPARSDGVAEGLASSVLARGVRGFVLALPLCLSDGVQHQGRGNAVNRERADVGEQIQFLHP